MKNMEALSRSEAEWAPERDIALFLETARALLPQATPEVDDPPQLMSLGMKYEELIKLYPVEHLPSMHITASAKYEIDGELVVITEDEETASDYHILCVDAYIGPTIRKQYECILGPYSSIQYHDYTTLHDAQAEPDFSSFSKPFTHDRFEEVMALLSKCNKSNALI